MTRIPIFSAAAIAIILGAAGPATAQNQPSGDRPNHLVERFMTIYDTNDNGVVSEA